MTQLAVTTQGRGPGLACLHGWALSSRVWMPLIERLDGQATIQTADLPGHGESPAGPAGLEAWTDAVLAQIDTPTVMMGWSLGGLVALNAARRRPEAIRGLVLVATLPRMLYAPDWPWGMKDAAIAATARGLEQDFDATLKGFLQQQVLAEPGAGEPVQQIQDELLAVRPDPAGLKAGLDILYEADLRAELAAIDIPALVVAGEHDRMAHPDGMSWLAEHMPRAEYWRVPGAAHTPFLSHADEFVRRTAAFMAALSPLASA